MTQLRTVLKTKAHSGGRGQSNFVSKLKELKIFSLEIKKTQDKKWSLQILKGFPA
jgi:hypothetical protein